MLNVEHRTLKGGRVEGRKSKSRRVLHAKLVLGNWDWLNNSGRDFSRSEALLRLRIEMTSISGELCEAELGPQESSRVPKRHFDALVRRK